MSQVWYLHILQSEIFQERSKIMNFYKRSYPPILRYRYTKGEISLHKHFKCPDDDDERLYLMRVTYDSNLVILITYWPSNLTYHVNFPCGRKPEYPEKTHDFRQSVDHTLHMRTGFGSALRWTSLGIEPGTLEVKSEWSDHYTTEAPI